MNRRGFLGLVAGAALGALVKTSGLAKLMPKLEPVESFVDVHFNPGDLSLSLEDFEARILKPAMRALAVKVDVEMMKLLTK